MEVQEEKANSGNAQPVDEISSRRFRWRIDNFSKLNVKKLYSDIFYAGGNKWRILLFPKGNNVNYLSVYLDAADSAVLPYGWTRYVQFSVSVISKMHNFTVEKETQHEFNARESDWGFTSFIRLSVLNDPANGFLVNDTCIFEIEIRLSEDQNKQLKRKEEAEAHLYSVPLVVRFRSLKQPKEDVFCLKLSKLNTYDDVIERVSQHLGLGDPLKIRLTSHNCYSHQPKPQPLKYRGVDHLSDMLVHYNQTSDILYYEILDIPLPELQGLKTLKVAFHHATKDKVVIHTVRLPKQSTVADVINDLNTKVELSHPNAEIRLLEVFYHKIYKIFPLNEKIESINDLYWTLRAEEIPEEEKNFGPHDCVIHVYHFMKDAAQNQLQVQNFGEPFLLVIREDETLAEVKVRIQKKLQVPNKEFAKWKFAFLSLGHPEYLQDNDIVASRFQRRDVYGAWEQYLGLEHTDNAPIRSYTATQGTSIKSQQELKPVDTRTVVSDAHVKELTPTAMNFPQKQSTPVASSSIIVEEQPQLETRSDEASVCPWADAPVTILTETSQQTEQVNPMADNMEKDDKMLSTAITPMADNMEKDDKMLSIPSGPLIVDPSSLHPQEPAIVEAEISSSHFSEFDALFADIQDLLGGKSSKSKYSSSFCPHACSVNHAKRIFRECLDMTLASIIQLGRAPELKNSFSIMLSSNAFPDNMVDFTTKFLANFEQYAGAQQDLREVQEKEKSIDEMETTMKQLASEFMPLRNQAETVEQEIAELERQLTEKKAKKAKLRKSFEDLAGRATTSKQALIDAQEIVWLLKSKKEQAEKMVVDMEKSWDVLQSIIL